MSAKHTPTPWKLTQFKDECCHLYSDTDDTLFIIIRPNPDGHVIGRTKANAEFIVRAVNSHEDLLAAAKKMLAYCIEHACVEKESLGVQGWNEAIAKAEVRP